MNLLKRHFWLLGLLSSKRNQPTTFIYIFRWEGKDAEEIGKNSDTDEVIVRIDPKYYRPTEVEILLGDPTKAQKELGWTRTVQFDVTKI